MSKPRKRNITAADKAAANRLKALWDAAVPERKEEGRPLTQQIMADRLESALGRGTQGAVSQYLNGHIALNYRALLAFADEVGFDPKLVRDDLPEQQFQSGASAIADTGPMTDHARRLALAETQIVIGIVAKVLAATIQPAGEELLDALEKAAKKLKNGKFVRATIADVREQLPLRQEGRTSPKYGSPKNR